MNYNSILRHKNNAQKTIEIFNYEVKKAGNR